MAARAACRGGSGLRLGLLVLLGQAACPPARQSNEALPAPDSAFELRAAEGALLLRVEKRGTAFSFTAPRAGQSGAQGSLALSSEGVEVTTGPVAPLSLGPAARPDGGPISELEWRGRDGLLRGLRRVDGLLRVGDAQKFPVARVRREGDGGAGEAILYDAGGSALVRVRAQGGRLVATDRDGKLLGFVVGVEDTERAALLFVPGMTASEQALLLAGPPLP